MSNFDDYITILLLKMLLENNTINQPTYDKAIKKIKEKEVT